MPGAQRIDPRAAKALMDSAGALLVAAYRGEGFKRNFLDGAISYDEFEERYLQLDLEQAVIFY